MGASVALALMGVTPWEPSVLAWMVGLTGDRWTTEYLSGLSSVEVLGSSEYLPSGSDSQE